MLRGAKSIADKIDFGSILLPVKSSDLEKLQPILDSGVFEKPVLKLSIYKNRPIYRDADHLSEYGNKVLTPMFKDALNP